MRATVLGLWMMACGPMGEAVDDMDAPEVAQPPIFAPWGESTDELETVAFVEVERYLGTWFEIATFPILFQRECARTTATYGVREEGGLSVYNQCRLGGLDGDPFAFTGKALPVDDTFARLDVSFFGDNGAPYWIIDLDGRETDAPYDWVLVSDPTMNTLWILHREPVMDPVLLEPLLERLTERGYDVDALSYTEQPEEPYDPVEDG